MKIEDKELALRIADGMVTDKAGFYRWAEQVLHLERDTVGAMLAERFGSWEEGKEQEYIQATWKLSKEVE
jgi:hypothetical protein